MTTTWPTRWPKGGIGSRAETSASSGTLTTRCVVTGFVSALNASVEQQEKALGAGAKDCAQKGSRRHEAVLRFRPPSLEIRAALGLREQQCMGCALGQCANPINRYKPRRNVRVLAEPWLSVPR